MVVIARVARAVHEDRALDVLEQPRIAVDVVAFDLMGGGGGAPQKTVWKFCPHQLGGQQSRQADMMIDGLRRCKFCAAIFICDRSRYLSVDILEEEQDGTA